MSDLSVSFLNEISSKVHEQGYCLLSDVGGVDAYHALCEQLGRVIHRCVVQTEAGAKSYLKKPEAIPYHTDSPFALRIAWFCVSQQDEGGEMFLKDTRKILHEAAPSEIESLANVKVRFPAVPGAHEAGELPLLFARGEERRINYAPWLADRNSLSPEAISVIEIFDDFPGVHSISIHLRPGNLLVIDNGRMLHGRAAIAGDQRKLLRAWIGDASPQ